MSRIHELDHSDYSLPPAELENILSPALVVYLPKVRRNLDTLLRCVGGDASRLRPHLKTTKIPAVWSELVRAGIACFKCATTREAEHMLAVLDAEGVTGGDLLVAYPHVGPALRALGELAKDHPATRVSVLSEHAALVADVPPEVGIFVDVNPGMNRTGIPMADRDAIHAVIAAAGDRFRGIHHYEGHVHDGSLDERCRACFPLYEDLLDLVAECAARGTPVAEVVTSGSPSFMPALAFEGFRELEGRHRVSPGTVVFFDARYEECMTEVDFVPAAAVLARVVSWPADGMLTVDAGSKAIAAEAGDPCALVIGRPDLHACTPSEEHLPFTTTGTRPDRGTPLLLVPRHVCPTVNLAEEAVLVDGGRIAITRVSARAHAASVVR